MKLKLENQAQATVLVVTETIEPSHLPILKAGLGKLVQAGKKAIVLDFSSVAEKDFKDPGLITQVQELKSWAETLGAKILVVSSIANLAHAPNREEALKLLNAPAGPVISADASPAEQEAALS